MTSEAAEPHEPREPREHGAAAKKAAKRSSSRRGGKSGKSHGEREATVHSEADVPEGPVAQQSLGLDEAPAEAATSQQPEEGTAPRAARKAARKSAAPRGRRPRKAVVESGEL